MQKFDNFLNCFQVLKNSNRELAKSDEIYRTGVIGQFSMTFELSWKLLQEVMRAHAVSEAENGSPREILKAGFKFMLAGKDQVFRKTGYLYDCESYIKAFGDFAEKMRGKVLELES